MHRIMWENHPTIRIFINAKRRVLSLIDIAIGTYDPECNYIEHAAEHFAVDFVNNYEYTEFIPISRRQFLRLFISRDDFTKSSDKLIN